MARTMKKYTFKNGDIVTSRLSADELVKRMIRLNILRVLTEGYEEGEGRVICNKAIRAYDKAEDFTGIIRLTSAEKEFLSYCLDSECLNKEEIECLRFYIGYTEEEWKEVISLHDHITKLYCK